MLEHRSRSSGAHELKMPRTKKREHAPKNLWSIPEVAPTLFLKSRRGNHHDSQRTVRSDSTKDRRCEHEASYYPLDPPMEWEVFRKSPRQAQKRDKSGQPMWKRCPRRRLHRFRNQTTSHSTTTSQGRQKTGSGTKSKTTELINATQQATHSGKKPTINAKNGFSNVRFPEL